MEEVAWGAVKLNRFLGDGTNVKSEGAAYSFRPVENP
jgi:hypothetical protein